MDKQKKDASAERLREEALARRLGEAFDQLAPANAAECPDAGVLAAYYERALDASEAAQCESHFAACSRCRKILAVLAASADAPLAESEVARLGDLSKAAGEGATSIAKTTSITKTAAKPRRTFRGVPWLAPALGVAAVLIVWFAVRPPWRTPRRSASEVIVAEGPKPELGAPGGIPAPAHEPSAENGATLQKNAEAPAKSSESEATRAGNNNGADNRAVSGTSAGTVGGITQGEAAPENALAERAKKIMPALRPSVEADKQKAGSTSQLSAQAFSAGSLATPSAGSPAPRQAAPPAAPSASVPQAEVQVRKEAPSASPVPGSTSQSVTVTGEAPVVDTTQAPAADALARDQQARAGQAAAGDKTSNQATTDLPLNGRNFSDLSLSRATVLVKTPSGAITWRAGKAGAVERSTDAGRTWISQQSPLREDWLAGAAVSDTTCWLAGRNGAIARTTDGQHWQKIAPPAQSANTPGKSPDWIGITARDAQSATITTGDQRRYVTQDSGKTWRAE